MQRERHYPVHDEHQISHASANAPAPHLPAGASGLPAPGSRRWLLRVLPGAAVSVFALLALAGCGGDDDDDDDDDD